MEFFLLVILLLVFVVLVGHGIWAVLAKLFSSKRRCAECGRDLDAPLCRACGSDERLFLNQLRFLLAQRRLDDATYSQVLRTLQPAEPSLIRLMKPQAAQAESTIPDVKAAPIPLAEVVPVARVRQQTAPPAIAETAAPVPAMPATSTPAPPEAAPAPGLRGTSHPPRRASGAVRGMPPRVAFDGQRPPEPPLRPVEPTAPPAPPAHKALLAFMEQRNIRWGEIIGGLLIVGCSVALVISLWSTIAQYPLLKFGVFTLVLAALFGAGLYAEHRWKLPTTSRGILLIAMLLVPLQFIAVAAMSAGHSPDAATIAGEAASAAVLLVMSMRAAKVLLGKDSRTIAVSFVLTASTVFAIGGKLLQSPEPGSVLLSLAPAMAIYLTGSAAAIAAVARLSNWPKAVVQRLFSAAGLLLYAMLCVAGFVVLSHTEPLPLRGLSPVAIALALPPLACGLLAMSRLERISAAAPWQTGAAAAACGGAALMLLSLVLAWPMPGWLLPLSLVVAAALLVAAFAADAAWAEAPAVLLVVAAGMLAVARVFGGLAWDASADAVIAALSHGRSAWVLFAASAVIGGVAWGLFRSGRRPHAASWGIVAALCAGGALAWTSVYTYAAAAPVSWGWIIYAVYAAALLAASVSGRLAWAGMAGWVLLLPACQHFTQATGYPWLYSIFDVGVLALLAAAGLPQFKRWQDRLAAPSYTAWMVSAFAAAITVLATLGALRTMAWGQGTMLLGAAAGMLLVCLLLQPSSRILAMAQIASAIAVIVIGMWYGSVHAHVLLSPRWLVQGKGAAVVNLLEFLRYGRPMLVALASLGLAWTLVRHLLARDWSDGILNAAWCADRVLTLLSLGGTVFLLLAPAAMAISLELGSQGIVASNNGIGLQMVGQAAMLLTWVLLALLLVNYLLETWCSRASAWLPAWAIAIWLACVAASFQAAPQLASASLLRWLVCGPMLAGAAALLLRGRLATVTGERFAHWRGGVLYTARSMTFLPAGAVILGVTGIAAALSLAGEHTSGPALGSLFASMGSAMSYLPPLLLLAGALVASGLKERVEGLTLAGVAVIHTAVTLAALLNLPAGVDVVQVSFWLIVLNAVTALLCALAWLGWWLSRDRALPRPASISVLASVGSVSLGIVVVWASLLLLQFSGGVPRLLPAICICIWLAAAAAAGVWWLLGERRLSVRALGAISFCVCIAAGLSVAAADSFDWPSSLVTLLTLLGAGAFMLLGAQPMLARINAPSARLLGDVAAAELPSQDGTLGYERQSLVRGGIAAERLPGVHAAVLAFAFAAFVFALCCLAPNPLAPWTAIGGLGCLCLLLGALGTLHARRGDFYLAAFPLLLAGSVWWGWFNSHLSGHHWLADLIHINVLCLAGAGAASLLLERLLLSHAPRRAGFLPLHRFAGVALTFLAGISALSVLLSQRLWGSHETLWLTWTALAATLGLVALLLWDERSALGLWLLYWSQFSAATLLAGSVGAEGVEAFYLTLLFWIVDSMIWLAILRRLQWLQQWGVAPDPAARAGTLRCAAIIVGAALLAVPLIEVGQHSAMGTMPLPLVGLYAVLAVLNTLILLKLALDPFAAGLQLRDRWRLGCVYAAESLVALLFLHIRLSMPWLFSGVFAQYWPLIVLLLAYGGAALGEIFTRRGVWVLAIPLQQTGAFLPLLPVLGYSAAVSRVDIGVTLVGAGLLYGMMAMLRRSFALSLLSVLALNGGLWRAFYLTPGLGIAQHPQLWVIPLALCVLIAAYLTRSRIPRQQFATVRGLCLGAVYVSSTADIFINGVAQAPYLPLVLGGFAIAGALAGMWLRVRSMLYLGAGFLLLAISCVIYHASVNLHQTWIIWLVGIACGGGILAVFALFEKKRQQVDELVAQLRRWER